MKIVKFPEQENIYCRDAVVLLSENVTKDTIAVGFFVLNKDRSVKVGYSIEAGVNRREVLSAINLLDNGISGVFE